MVADRGYRGLRGLADRRGLALDIKAPPALPPGAPASQPRHVKGTFVPIAPLYRVENAFAQLGRWRRLARCFEQTREGAQAWLEVACVGYLLGRV